jgi:Glycosyltransferase family 87
VIASNVVRHPDGSRSATRAVVLSALGVGLFAAFAAASGSPFQPVLPPGAGPGGPFHWLGDALGFDQLGGAWLVATGVAITLFCVVAFLLLLREAWRGNVSVRTVIVLAVIYHLVVLTLPLLFSRDVYSYAFYGRIAATYHANPYIRTPVEFAHDPLWPYVGPKWVDTPAVYGPLWTQISSFMAHLIHSPAGMVKAYRWIAVAASLATIAVIYDTTKRVWPARTAFAVVAFGLNPVTLFHSVASGHNDLLVALAIAGAFAFLVRGKEMPAIAVLSLGTLVKAVAIVPLLLVLVWCVARVARDRRWRTAFTHVGLSAVIGVGFALPFLNLHDPTLGMAQLASNTGWLAPSPTVTRLVDKISFGTFGWLARVVFALMVVVVVAALARDVARRATERTPRDLGAAMGWALVLMLLLGPVLLPWYVMWALPLAWLLPRAPRVTVIAAGVGLALAQWDTEPLRYPGPFGVNLSFGHLLVVPVMIVLLIWSLAVLRHRLHLGLPLEDQEKVPEPAGSH